MQVVSPQHWNRYTFILIQKCLSDHLLDYEMKSYDNPKSTGYLGILHSVRNWSIVISPCSVFTTPSTPSILISVPTTSLCSPCMTFTWNWWPRVNHSFSLHLIKCWLMTESIVACSLLMDRTNTMKTFTNINAIRWSKTKHFKPTEWEHRVDIKTKREITILSHKTCLLSKNRPKTLQPQQLFHNQ